MKPFRLAALLCIGLFLINARTVQCQMIRVQLLNGKTGRPIKKAKLQIAYLNSNLDAFQEITDKDGLISFNSRGEKSFAVTTLFNIDCGEQAPGGAERTYAVNTILLEGIVTHNTCGKRRAEPVHGKLIFYVRAANWLELLKN